MVLLVYLANTSRLADPVAERPFVIAHRGLAQSFEREGLDQRTCTAARMLPPVHGFLENTLPSMEAAFALGAEIVEFDIHMTVDRQFAVFHDWTLECRTEGRGVTHEHTLEELQRLDVGYGYTADDGKTWPFRGTAVGWMPSMEQVLTTFPGGSFLIDVKGGSAVDGALLADRLAELTAQRSGEVAVYGASQPVEVVRERLPQLRTMTRPRLKRCLTRYLAIGWTGYVPQDCRQGFVFVPANAARWFWGWPNRMLRRMDRVGSRVVLIGDYAGEGFSRGFDDPTRLPELPHDYSGGIWTDRVDLIAPAVTARR